MRPLLVWACAGLRVACGAVCRGCNRVAADRLGAGECARMVRGVSIGGVWCSRPADNQIGAAGAEALARALPPSLTVLVLNSTCSWGLYCGRCWSGHALGCGLRVERCAEVATGWRRIGSERASAHVWCGGVVLEGVVLAACRQPNRSCGRRGAGARTAAESDGALSQRYVRLGACIAAAVGPGMRCAAGRVWCGVPRLQPGGGGSARMGASAHVWFGGVVSEGCGARGLQGTKSELRA